MKKNKLGSALKNIKKEIKDSKNSEFPFIVKQKINIYLIIGFLFSGAILVLFTTCIIFNTLPFIYIFISIIPALIGLFLHYNMKLKIYKEGWEVFTAKVIEDSTSVFSSGSIIPKPFQKNDFYAEVEYKTDGEKQATLYLIPYKKGVVKTPSLVGNEIKIYVTKTAKEVRKGDVFLIDGLLGYEVI
jgi:hypothetical protein